MKFREKISALGLSHITLLIKVDILLVKVYIILVYMPLIEKIMFAGMSPKLFKRFVAATVAQKWVYFLSLSLIHFQTRSATNRLSDFDEDKAEAAQSIYHSIPYHSLKMQTE